MKPFINFWNATKSSFQKNFISNHANNKLWLTFKECFNVWNSFSVHYNINTSFYVALNFFILEFFTKVYNSVLCLCSRNVLQKKETLLNLKNSFRCFKFELEKFKLMCFKTTFKIKFESSWKLIKKFGMKLLIEIWIKILFKSWN